MSYHIKIAEDASSPSQDTVINAQDINQSNDEHTISDT